MPGARVQGLAFAVHMDGRKYLIGRAGQKKKQHSTLNKCYLADSADSQEFQRFTKASVLCGLQGAVPASAPAGVWPCSVGLMPGAVACQWPAGTFPGATSSEAVNGLDCLEER